MGLQLARVTRDRKDLFNALAQAYHEIFVPAFPDDDERESLEKIHHLLEGKTPGIDIIVNLAGENLESETDRVVKGIAIAYYYREGSVGLLGYNAVSPLFKCEGIGKKLVLDRIQSLKEQALSTGSPLRAVFVDCNNPAKVPAGTDSMDPNLRLKLYTGWGARPLPFNYVQPPLDAGLNYCDKMILLSYPVDGRYATAQDVSAYIDAIYREALPDEDPATNPYVLAMRKQLSAMLPEESSAPQRNARVIFRDAALAARRKRQEQSQNWDMSNDNSSSEKRPHRKVRQNYYYL